MTSLHPSRLVVSQRFAAGWENCRSLGFAYTARRDRRDDKGEDGDFY
jgi:hypothetical protein